MQDLLQIYESTFEKGFFSSSDKKLVKSYLQENPVEKREKDFIRSKLFTMARTAIEKGEGVNILDWLENANKSLFGKRNQETDNVVFFSPGEECLSALTSRLQSAVNYINICVFTISDDRITDAILKAHQINVNVRIVTDNDKVWDAGSDIRRMYEAGIPVKIDNSLKHMHHKFVVIDGKVALTGSYNWTRSAAAVNYENLLLTTQQEIVKSYDKEFVKLWDEMNEFGEKKSHRRRIYTL